MNLRFEKIKRENIFEEDFEKFNKNNNIDFKNTSINILYAPNGVGKSSFCKVLEGNGEYIVNFNDKQYNEKNCKLFHIINDQNSRNIIKGTAKDFLLGDNIAKEYELKAWIDSNFENIYKNLKSYYKNELNLTKVTDKRFGWIEKDNEKIVKEIINSKNKYTSINLDELYEIVKKIETVKIDEYEKEKFEFINDETNHSIISEILKIEKIMPSQEFYKIEQCDDAIKILNKYDNIDECIVCDSNINRIELLNKKEQLKDKIILGLDENTKNIVLEIISKLPNDDPFKIKETLSQAIVNNAYELILSLTNELKKYIDIINNLVGNALKNSLNKKFIEKYVEYKEMIKKELNFSDEDLMFIEEFVEKNINKSIKLTRKENKISITIDSEDLLETDRNELKLSSGEQNFISLTFELLKAKNIDKDIIVIDDPISSFDSIYKNKLVFAIVKFLELKKVILLTHNIDLIKLVKFQYNKGFNLYLFNNFENQENGFIPINENETNIMISITGLLDFIRSDKISHYIKKQELYLISLIPFMRGYVMFTGDTMIKNQLTELMHGYNNKKIDISCIYSKLFSVVPSIIYSIDVNDILSVEIDNISEIVDKDNYPLLNRVLQNNLIYLYLRLKTEKVLVQKYNICYKKHDQLASIIAVAFKENTMSNKKNKIFFYSKKTLLNEFNHFDGNMNIFQPAIDISEEILNKEKDEIIYKLNSL